jgi:acyl-CoA-dependent ceramide synthase
MFGLFMVVWVAARHIIFMMATYSVYAHSDTASPPGCYKGKMGSITGPFPPPDRFGHLLEPFTNPEGLVCWTGPVKWGFVDSLLFLQVLTLIWFSMIVKVAIKVLKGGQADDTRSDDENESENEDEQIETKSKKGKSSAPTEPSPSVIRLEPFEEEVGVESLNLRNRTLVSSENRHRKSAGHASGASIANKKQLLDRIGCDKKTSD